MSTLPHWDLSDVYPGLDSREFAAAREAYGADVARLVALYDEHDVRGGDALAVDATTVPSFEAARGAANEILNQLRLVNAYVSSSVTTAAPNDAAQRELAGPTPGRRAIGRASSTRRRAYSVAPG